MNKKIYSFILMLYPKSHRARFGAEMMQVFEDTCSEAADRGALLGFWVRIISDAVVSASAERAATLQSKFSSRMDNAFLKPSIGKVLLAAVPLLPLYWILVLACIAVSMKLPHPHTNGLGAILALSIIALVPAFVSATISYLCACGLVGIFTRTRTV